MRRIMLRLKQISLKTLFVDVAVVAIGFALAYSKWNHAISVKYNLNRAPGDLVDVFMMPPDGTYLDGGWEMERLCAGAKIAKINELENTVVIKVSIYDKWQLQNCDRDLWISNRPGDLDSIWVD